MSITEANSSTESGWSEDVWAMIVAGIILAVGFSAVFLSRPQEAAEMAVRLNTLESDSSPQATDELKQIRQRLGHNPLARFVTKLQRWNDTPVQAFQKPAGAKPLARRAAADLLALAGAVIPVAAASVASSAAIAVGEPQYLVGPIVVVGVVSLFLFGLGAVNMGESWPRFAVAFAVLFSLTVLAYLLASHEVVKHYNLEYPLWALLVGLIIANTVGTPDFLRPAVKTEFYIKTGIVLLGAKLLLGRLLALGLPGICVSWLVTPVVLITTFCFGQRILKIASPSLNMTISADMSVCGVSAAIATAAACKAKKEELSTAVGLSLMFTAIMMFVMPQLIQWLGLSPILGGAWLGGTIDATGAVAAAGAFLGPEAESVAITVKMIQNILIGVIAFGVATYWVARVEASDKGSRPDIREIWQRFPKFILGFLAASIVFSLIVARCPGGEPMVTGMIKGTSDVFRGWFFCLAFVSIGLDTNFRELAKYMSGGKPVVLYIAGQTLNLLLTLGMAWLMFEVVFQVAK